MNLFAPEHSRRLLILFLLGLAPCLSFGQSHQVEISTTFYTIPSDKLDSNVLSSQAEIGKLLASPPPGSKVLASPSLVTLSGMNAQVEIVREFIYPTEYKEAEDGSLLPLAMETRELGYIFNVTPTVTGGESPTILLASVIEVSELAGWLDMKQPHLLIPPFSETGAQTNVVGTRALQPLISSYNFNSSVSLKDGETVHFAGGLKNGTKDQYFVSVRVTLREVALPPGVAETEKKLRGIVIPQLSFREASVEDVLAFLAAPKGAPNIVLKGKSDARVTLSLRNVTLKDALQFVADISDLRIEIKNGTVSLSPIPAEEDPFEPAPNSSDPFAP